MRTLLTETRLTDFPIDRRRHVRRPAEGSVSLIGDGLTEVTGQLLDVSEGGFRASHHCAELTRGVEVTFRHSTARGRARIVWNRISGGNFESGFLIL